MEPAQQRLAEQDQPRFVVRDQIQKPTSVTRFVFARRSLKRQPKAGVDLAARRRRLFADALRQLLRPCHAEFAIEQIERLER